MTMRPGGADDDEANRRERAATADPDLGAAHAAPPDTAAVSWVTQLADEASSSTKRHLWQPVPWQLARNWPPQRLRTLCGIVVPLAAVPDVPADVSAREAHVRVHHPSETAALELCGRCQRALAGRRAKEGERGQPTEAAP